jgi:gephyrin
VSDTAFANASLDRSGPTIREIVRVAGCECLDDNDSGTAIVPDEIAHIQAAVQRWIARGDVDWIITTGGTGFGVRDRTPEVCVCCVSQTLPPKPPVA